MKKTLIKIGCFVALSIGIAGCKGQLDDYYVDPDKTTNPTIEKLFSSILDNNRARPNYSEMREIALPMCAAYCQTAACDNKEERWIQTVNPVEALWNDYYTPSNQGTDINYNTGNGVMAQYRTMQRLYNNLPLDERPNFNIFMMAGKALLLDQTAQMIDMFGDIPYTQAGSLDMNNTISNAAFQNQKELYDSVLIGLKDISEWFAATTPNAVAAASFSAQDYLMKGSIDKWRRYVNSLRLRYLMRISRSDVDEARAKDEIEDILGNPIFYPLVDGDFVGDNYNPANTDILLYQLTNYNNQPMNSFTEIRAQMAPEFMLNNVMIPANDPRIPFMFDKNTRKDGTPNRWYGAMKQTEVNQADSMFNYSIWDSTTYLTNAKLPGIYMSASEVNFLKAEAFERWGLSGGTAQQSYELGVRQAIAFINFLHNINPNQIEPLTQPSTITVSNYLSNPLIAYTGTSASKLEKIYTQKWLHFNVLQSRQAWAEWRRTGYPRINIIPATRPGYEMPPNRFMYPASEIAYNSSYEAIRNKDTREAKIFWMGEY
ncbi:SusD/RagB family nutrient-binding outer membrane lipoprotein [Chitinophaga rhizophila]|uniref:SusD/RagB family nutrient-binding outer membrane lipoprotein n=1 Tax=Chitinophaga rhizophila TaxID=2866212 RepID=A0ABS7GJX8_9BACT|nr:SusD/RagB family nutrient-binding outer membrane lipoprotein [Chitinophaga rhizophila]MBW8688028.1 SusD/RagB family nutrient-binding outer membrane lipoprotein [Chitinophaga rhizophila]